jgi:hypothetical protein
LILAAARGCEIILRRLSLLRRPRSFWERGEVRAISAAASASGGSPFDLALRFEISSLIGIF